MERMRVLLVDDEVEFLDLLCKRLHKRNMNVSAVTTGQAALEALEQQEFDVIVLDMRMPGMDGLETLRRIKALAPDTEVVMLTGHADAEAATIGMDLGIFDYLIKPVAISELILKLQDAYANKKLRESS